MLQSTVDKVIDDLKKKERKMKRVKHIGHKNNLVYDISSAYITHSIQITVKKKYILKCRETRAGFARDCMN